MSLNFEIVSKECFSSAAHRFIPKGDANEGNKIKECICENFVLNFLMNCSSVGLLSNR